MSKQIIKSSPSLYQFYVDYARWMNDGAIPGMFSRCCGLCSNLFDYCTEEEAAPLLEEMHEAFAAAGLHKSLPFNDNVKHYKGELAACACHLNSARIAWVRARIDDVKKFNDHVHTWPSRPFSPPPFPGSSVDATRYAYDWNIPGQAVSRDLAPSWDGFDYLMPDGTRKHLDAGDLFDLFAMAEKPERSKWLRRRLASLPHYVRRHFAAKLDALDAKNRKAADCWLINTFERHVLTRIDSVNSVYQPDSVMPGILLPVRERLFRILWAGKRELKRLAYTLADIFTSEFIRESDHQLARTGDPGFAALSGYGRIASLAVHLKTPIPGWTAYCNEELEAEDALRAVLRLESPQWWLNRLRRIHSRWREHLMIAAGYVQKKSSPYSSAPCLTEWLAQKKANREYLKAMELEDQDTGARISLIDKVAGSVANPANRRRELMTRMRGFEDLAKLEGLAGDFYTLTAPSCYHSMQHNGRRNNKYCGASPRETQQYLCKVWARTRAAWKRKGIRVFGFRVVEPHHDATPHWHLLLFMRPERVGQAREIFRKYALKEDGNEPGAQENRFQVVPIDDAHGSATGYIAKYISKNIDGFALDGEKDDETGEDLKEMSLRVSAWASRWSIRQFQQIGGAPVTVYRELRRLGDRELVLHPEMETARQAADAGEWGNYVQAQGGPLVERDKLRIRLNYETTENGNAYGDDVQRITGIYCPITGNDSLIFTRTTQYKIVPKRQDVLGADGVAVDVDFSGGSAAPRSSVNNCTRDPATGADGVEHAASEAAVQSEMTVPAEGVTVNFDALSRQEKRELAQRLRNDLRTKRKKRPSEREEGAGLSVKERQISELLALRGIDASVGMVRSIMAGASVACGDLVLTVQGGRLLSRSRAGSRLDKLPSQVMAMKLQASSLINRMKKAFSGPS